MSRFQVQQAQCLSIQELLLLNILLYFSDKDSLCLQSDDFDHIFQTVQDSPSLTGLQFISATTIPEEGAVCAAFLNQISDEKNKELIVVFRGTSKGEWLDNFLGGAATDEEDGVSTRQQIRALKWYQALQKDGCYVTVTGHSKGGNKAKYITVLDDSVDRCVSFNGQGFSEEFVDWYYARIGIRQGIIENHNTEYDYVNWLLHDFGTTFYYKNQMPERGFLAGHCSNAFLKWEKDGAVFMEKTGQERPEMIQELDKTLNQILHVLPKRQKIELAAWIGARVQAIMDQREIDQMQMDRTQIDETKEIRQILIEISHFFQAIF